MNDYIYLPDSASDGIYCSRCGKFPFEELERRSSHQDWIYAIQEHQECEDPDAQPSEPM